MATSSSSAPEEARPPESQYRKLQYRKNADLNTNYSTCQNVTVHHNDTNNGLVPRSTRISGLRNVLFPKRKISCIASTDSERSLTELNDSTKPISVIQVPKENSVKTTVTPSNSVVPPNSTQGERPKTRHSVHLDVEEALSSLLWQPYEYQNANNQDRYSLSSYDDSNCSCSSGSGGSSRSDLVDKFGTSAYCYGTNNGNMAAVVDRHYLMKNTKTSNNNNSKSIYCNSNRRRRRTVGVLEGGGGRNDGVALNVAYLTRAVEVRDSLYSYASVSAHNQAFVATPAVTSSLYHPSTQYIHGTYPNGGTMRTELPQPALVSPLLPTLPPRPINNNIVEITTNNNNVSNMVLPLGSTGNSNSSTAASSLYTANVVGLPQHCRQSSIPISTCTNTAAISNSRGGTVIFPIPSHPRTASEPFQQRYHPSAASVVPMQRQHVEGHLRAAQAATGKPIGRNYTPSTSNSTMLNVFSQPPPHNLMTGVMKNDFNTPQQRAPLDLSIHGGTTTTTEHFNIVHHSNRMVPIDQQQSKPQLSITHQRIPSDFNGSRGEDGTSNTTGCSTVVPSQLHITHQRTVSDIAQSSTVRNDPIHKFEARTVAAGTAAIDMNSRMVPEMMIANNGNGVFHQRSSSIPNNSKNTATGSTGGVLNVSNVNVNYYRAVPVHVVSAVPTIHCVNTNESLQQPQLHNNGTATSTNISNVNIIQAMSSNNNSSTNDTTSNLYKSHSTSHSVSTTTLNSNDNNNTTCTEVIVHSTQDQITAPQPPAAPPRLFPLVGNTRTFTSTEAQTDEIITTADINTITSSTQPDIAGTAPVLDPAKEQRRRERRERKHQRRMNNVNHRHNTNQTSAVVGTTSIEQWSGTSNANPQQPPPPTNNRLPDILNSHLPPPYSSTAGTTSLATGSPAPAILVSPIGFHPHHHHGVLPLHHQGLVPTHSASGVVVPPGGPIVPGIAYLGPVMPQGSGGQVPLVPAGSTVHHPQAVPVVPVVPSSGFRFPFPTTGFRRSRYSDDHPPKGCCGLLSWKPGSLRWFIALIALVAVCCVLVGTALGAMRPAGRDHLTVSLLMIGVGIVLVTVSAIAWRLTSHSPTTGCRSILGLGPATSTESIDNAICTTSSRRFVPRLPPAYGGGRPHHPYAAMLYPEFQYRPPPPTYQASMQEYRLRLLLLDRVGAGAGMMGSGAVVASPPPTYRSGYGGGGGIGGSSVSGSLLRSTLSHRRTLQGGGNINNPPSIIDTVPIHVGTHSDYSTSASLAGPPSYRSTHTSLAAAAVVARPAGTQQHQQQHIVLHSRDHSLTLSESVVGSTVGRNGGVNVVSILNGGGDGDGGGVRLVMNGEGGYEVVGVGALEGCGVDDIKLDGGPLDPTITDLVEVVTGSSKIEDPDNQTSTANHIKDGNLVTIVQTGDDQSPVIVTVSGGGIHHHTGALCTTSCVVDSIGHNQIGLHRHHHHHHQLVNGNGAINQSIQISEIGGSEMEILAHL